MANFTALMNVVVDATEASKGLKNLDTRLTKIQKSSKSTSSSLSRLEKTFDKIEKSIKSVVSPIQKMESNLNKLVGKSMSGYLRIVQRLQKDNFKLKTSIKAVNDQINVLNSDISKLNQKIDALEKRLNKVGGGKTKEKIGGLAEAFKNLGKTIQRNEYLFYSLASGVLNFIKINLVGALIRITDQFVLMENRIRLVNSSQAAFNNNMAAVKQIAQETRQSLYAIANLYSRVGRNSKELGADTIALATTVSTIAKSFQIAGATAEEARNAIVQLSQALASGRLQGDELRSILELAPTLANSIAKSIGITLGSLRSFASEGLITTSIITKAVRESAKEIDEEFQKIVPTISQSMTNIQNAFQIVLGETKEIKEANEIAALSFLNLAKNIEKLSGSPAFTKLGEFLKSVALSINDVIVGLTVFVGLLSGVAVVGVLAALLGGFGAAFAVLTGLVIAAGLSIQSFKDATEQLAIPIKGVDEVIKNVNQSLEENAKKTGESVTESEKAAAQFSALKTESYEAGLQIDLFNRKLADLNQQLNDLRENTSDEGWLKVNFRRFLNDAFPIGNALEVIGFDDVNLGDILLGPEPAARIKELEGEINRLNTMLKTANESKDKIDSEIKKRQDAAGDDGVTAGQEFIQNFLNATERTNRRLSARFQEIRDAFQDKFNKPFDIRFTPAKESLAELNDALRRKIGDIGEKRAKGSQLEFGGVGFDVEELRKRAMSGQQLTAESLGIKETIAAMLAGNKIVQDAGEAIPSVLLAEIEAAANEELLKFQEKVLSIEAQMEAGLKQRLRDQSRVNEGMETANKHARRELAFLKDGLRLHENKIAKINEEYYYKRLNLKEDLKGLGYLDDEINKQLELLEAERQKAVEAERIAKAKKDLLYLESELDKLRSTQFQMNMADKEYGLLKNYNDEYDRRKMLRQEERYLLLEMKKIEWEAQGLQGEKLRQAQQIFEAQLDTEDSLRRQQLLLDAATRTERTRLDLEARSTQYQSEKMNDWAEKNRLDAFLMKDQIENLNKYNAEVIKATQEAGISVDFLVNDKNVLDEYGLSLLELPSKLDGVDQVLLNNLRERIELLKEILGIENEIDKQKNENAKEENKVLEALRKKFPGIQSKGSKENDLASGIANIIKDIDKKSETRGEIRDIQKAQVEADKSAHTEQLAKLGIFGQGGEGGFFSMFEGLFGDLMGGFGDMFGELGSLFGDLFGNLGGIMELGFDFLLDGVMSVAGILLKIFIATIESEKFKEAVNNFNEALDRPFDLIGDGLAQIFQGIGALMEPLYYIGDIVGGFMRGIIRGFTRILEPIGKLFESIQPVFITIGVALQTLVLFFNQIFGFVGNLLNQIVEFISGSTEDGYKSLVLLKAERDTLQEIETALEGVVDVLRKIEDVLFDIVNSSLNLAAPSIKLENAVEQYNKLFGAASQIGATEEDIDTFNAFAKEFLQQAQDVLKSSSVYQDIYDNVIKDIMSLTGVFTDQMGRDVINALQKGSFDLKVVGSDIGDAIDQLVQKFNEGTVSFTTMVDYISLKLNQVMADIALRDTAEFGGLDIGREFERFQQMRGAAISSSSLEEDLANLTAGSSLYSAVLDAYAQFDATTANVSTASTSIESDSVVISARTLARTSEANDVTSSSYSAESALDLSGYEAPTDLPGTLDVDNPFDLFNIDGVKLIEDLLTWIFDAVAHALEQIWGTFAELMEFITEPLTRIFDGSFAAWVEELLDKTFGLITDGTFAKFVEELFGGLFGIFTDGTFAKFVEELFNGLFGSFTDGKFVKFVEELFNGLFGSFTDGSFVSFVEELFNGLFGSFTDGSFVKFIEELFSGIFGSFTDGNFIKFIQELFGGLFEKMGSLTTGDFLTALMKPIADLTADIGDWVDAAIVQPLADMGGLDIADWIENILLKPVQGLAVGLIDYFTAILYPILSIGEVDFGSYISAVFWPIRDLVIGVTDFVAAVLKPITDITGVSVEDFISNIFKPLEGLALSITDWISSILTDPLSSLDLDASSFMAGLLAPIEGIGVDGAAIVEALLAPLENIESLGIDEWIKEVLETPISAMESGSLSDIIDAFFAPWAELEGSLSDLLNILSAPFSDLEGSLSDLLDIIKAPFKDLEGALSDLVSIISDPFSGLEGGISDIIGVITSPFEGVEGALSDIIGVITAPFEDVEGALSDILGILTAPFKDLEGGISDILGIITAPFKGLEGGISDIVTVLSTPFSGLEGGLSDIIGILKAPFSGLEGGISDLLNIIKAPFSGLEGTVANLLDIVKAPFTDLEGKLSNLLDIVKSPFSGLSGTVSNLLDIVKAPFSGLEGTVANLLGIVQAPFTGLSGAMSDLLDIISTAISGLSGDVDLSDIGQTIINAITFSDVTYDLFSDVSDALKDLFGVPTGDTIQLLYNPFHDYIGGPEYFLEFAKGGQVPGGLLNGPSHREGGIPGSVGGRPIEMEGGEFIINKKSTSLLGMDFLSRINSVKNPNQIPGEAAYFRSGGKIQKFEDGTKVVPPASDTRAQQLAEESRNSPFKILNFSAKTGGTIADIVGEHGIDVNLSIPEFIRAGDDVSDIVKIFKNGGPVLKFGKGGMTKAEAAAKSEAMVTDQYAGDNDLIYTIANRLGNDVIGYGSLEIGLANRMTKGIFNASYEPPPWIPDWVKEAVEAAGQAAVDVFTDPAGFLQNISDQVGKIIEDITQALGEMIQDVVENIFSGSWWSSGGSPDPFQYDQRVRFLENMRNAWWPDNPKTVASIAGILNLDMISSDIAEIKSSVYDLWDYWRNPPLPPGGILRSGGPVEKYETGGIVKKYPEGGEVATSYGIDPGTGQPVDSGNWIQDFTNDIFALYVLPSWESGFDALGGANAGRDVQQKYIDVLMEYLIGGTAIAKSFSRNGKYGWADKEDMNDYNPFLGSHQSTSVGGHGRPSGVEGYLWDGLQMYGLNFTHSNRPPNFMGGWDNVNETGSFVELFGDPNGKYRGAGIGGGKSYIQQAADAGAYGYDMNWDVGYSVPSVSGDISGMIARFAMAQTNPFDLLSLNYNGLKQAQPLVLSRIYGGSGRRLLISDRNDADLERIYENVSIWKGKFQMRNPNTGEMEDISSLSTFKNMVAEGDRWMSQSQKITAGTYPNTYEVNNQGFASPGMGFYKKGGMVIGPSHEEGGIIAEFEGGEYIINKEAVKSIGVDNLDMINYGGGVVLDVPKFPTGGVVVGRRDYDPLLAQAITEQYRNADLEGGTYEQVQAIYNALQDTGLSSDTGATLTEIFGTPEGFWDQINFEGITEDGISNSIIDGISDVFDDPGTGGTGGSYPVTVVSEEMYLMYMTRPLDSVVVTAANYMEYMTTPLPSNVYQSNYLAYMFTPFDGLGEKIQEKDYLNRLFEPLFYVEASADGVTEAFSEIISDLSINQSDFSDAVIGRINEMPEFDLDGDLFISELLKPLDDLSLTSEQFLSLFTPVFNAIVADADKYLELAMKPIEGLQPEQSEVLEEFFSAFSNVQSADLTDVFKDILYAVFDFSIISAAIDDLIEKYSTDENNDSDLRLSFGTGSLIDKLDELWAQGLVVYNGEMEDEYASKLYDLIYEGNANSHLDTLEDIKKVEVTNQITTSGGGGGGGASNLYDFLLGNSDIRNILDYIVTPEGREELFGQLGYPTEVFKNLNDFIDINTKSLQFDPMDVLDMETWGYNISSIDRLGNWIDSQTDTLPSDLSDYDPGVLYGDFKRGNLGETEGAILDGIVTAFGTAGLDAALESVLGVPTVGGLGPVAFLVAYEAANPGSLAETITSAENLFDAASKGDFSGMSDLSDDFQGIIDIGNMYKVPRDFWLGVFGFEGFDLLKDNDLGRFDIRKQFDGVDLSDVDLMDAIQENWDQLGQYSKDAKNAVDVMLKDLDDWEWEKLVPNLDQFKDWELPKSLDPRNWPWPHVELPEDIKLPEELDPRGWDWPHVEFPEDIDLPDIDLPKVIRDGYNDLRKELDKWDWPHVEFPEDIDLIPDYDPSWLRNEDPWGGIGTSIVDGVETIFGKNKDSEQSLSGSFNGMLKGVQGQWLSDVNDFRMDSNIDINDMFSGMDGDFSGVTNGLGHRFDMNSDYFGDAGSVDIQNMFSGMDGDLSGVTGKLDFNFANNSNLFESSGIGNIGGLFSSFDSNTLDMTGSLDGFFAGRAAGSDANMGASIDLMFSNMDYGMGNLGLGVSNWFMANVNGLLASLPSIAPGVQDALGGVVNWATGGELGGFIDRNTKDLQNIYNEVEKGIKNPAKAAQNVATNTTNTVKNILGIGTGGLINFANGGGLAKGPSHQSGMLGLTKGGSPFLFEGGEYIINKKTTEALGEDFLGAINSLGEGGINSFFLGGVTKAVKKAVKAVVKPVAKKVLPPKVVDIIDVVADTVLDPVGSVKSIFEKGLSPGGAQKTPEAQAQKIFEKGITPGGVMAPPGSQLEKDLEAKAAADQQAKLKKQQDAINEFNAKVREFYEQTRLKMQQNMAAMESMMASSSRGGGRPIPNMTNAPSLDKYLNNSSNVSTKITGGSGDIKRIIETRVIEFNNGSPSSSSSYSTASSSANSYSSAYQRGLSSSNASMLARRDLDMYQAQGGPRQALYSSGGSGGIMGLAGGILSGAGMGGLGGLLGGAGLGGLGGLLFANGGYVAGRSHEQGGILAELEGGEFVMNRSSTSSIGRGMLESMNNSPSEFTKGLSEHASMNNNLLMKLIDVVENKDLSVSIYDENGNKNEQSSLKIKRKEQLEYRNASELA